jgi:hypothetical protein
MIINDRQSKSISGNTRGGENNWRLEAKTDLESGKNLENTRRPQKTL